MSFDSAFEFNNKNNSTQNCATTCVNVIVVHAGQIIVVPG